MTRKHKRSRRIWHEVVPAISAATALIQLTAVLMGNARH